MNIRRIARALGRLGGLARARKLSPQRRREIASQGGRSKSMSRHAARRLQANFTYVEWVKALRRAGRRHGL